MSKVLLRDEDWMIIEGRLCQVSRFTPFARVEAGKVVSAGRKTPYAVIALECVEGQTDLPPDSTGMIGHKVDFQHLWSAFVERGIGEDEAVVIVWGKKYLRGLTKIFSVFMPRLIVMVFTTRGLGLLTDSTREPDLKGYERFLAEKPVAEWRPKMLG
jgi:hypothetical protein